jgi:hypothetical protein
LLGVVVKKAALDTLSALSVATSIIAVVRPR